MIEHEVDRRRRLLILRPTQPPVLDDAEEVARSVDRWLADGNSLRGLLLDISSLADGTGVGDFMPNLRFASDHHQRIPRVALVGCDAEPPGVSGHFAAAFVRRFPAGEHDAALRWLDEEASSGVRLVRTSHPRVFVVELGGLVTRLEYQALVDRMADEMNGEPASFLVDVVPFQGAQWDTFWEDFKLAVRRLRQVRRIALVGEQPWFRGLARIIDSAVLIELRSFTDGQRRDAVEWLSVLDP